MMSRFKQGFINSLIFIFWKTNGKCSYCGKTTKLSLPCYYCTLGVCKECGFMLDDLPVHHPCATMIWYPEHLLTDEKIKELSDIYIKGMKSMKNMEVSHEYY